jgi:hypothetical protein
VQPDGNIVTVGDTTGLPDQNPCQVRAGSSGFAARYFGLGAIGKTTAFKATLTGLRKSYSAKAAQRNGITARVGCNAACKIQLTVTASPAVARVLKISRKVRTCTTRNHRRTCRTTRRYVSITVDRAGGSLGSGARTFKLNWREFKRAVVAFKTTRLSLQVTVTPATGRNVVFKRILTFHR